MQKMRTAQQPSVARARDRIRQQRGMTVNLRRVRFAPDTQRIQHGGDAGGRDLRIIGDHRRDRIPIDLRARHDMGFEMVGVQFDQAGHHKVALGVLAAGGRVAFVEAGDLSIRHRDPAAFDNAIGEDDLGIADDGFGLAHCFSLRQ